MPNRFVIFPAEKAAEAQAYKEWGDAQYRLLSGEVNGVLGPVQWDAFGQPVVLYYGPPFVYVDEVPEPAGGPTMRADGVLHDNWVRPPNEDA